MKTKARQRLIISSASGPDFSKRMGLEHLQDRLTIEERFSGRHPGLRRLLVRFFRKNFFRLSIHSFLALIGKRAECRREQATPITRINSIEFPDRIKGTPESIRILHLSDLHIDASPSLAFYAADRIRSMQPDFAVITGDYFNGYRVPDAKIHELLDPILECLSCPVFGILGNHDSLSCVPHLEKRGVRMLLNESAVFKSFGIRVLISGIDDPHLFKTHDIPHALQSVQQDMERFHLKLLLSHAPSTFREAEKAGFDLMLSGHTHGGQFCLPKGRPLATNGKYPRFVVKGPWMYKSLYGYTSHGLGTGTPALRMNCPAEITLHEIRFS